MPRKTRSALFIDFENVPIRAAPQTVAALLAWLEDGHFATDARRRRLLHRRIYWNSSAELHRKTFEAAGFHVVRCDKYAALKNGADIRMTLDIAELLMTEPRIEEYILITRDADFIPVLERLKEKGKSTVIMADEHKPASYTALVRNADLLLPYRRLGEAFAYERKPRGLFQWLRRARPAAAASSTAPTAPPSRAAGAAPRRETTAGRRANGSGESRLADSPVRSSKPRPAASTDPGLVGSEPTSAEPIAVACQLVLALAKARPKQPVGRKKILAALLQVPGFTNTGPEAFLGRGSYRELMIEVVNRSPGLVISFYDNAGLSISWGPAAGPAHSPVSASPSGPSTTGPAPEEDVAADSVQDVKLTAADAAEAAKATADDATAAVGDRLVAPAIPPAAST